MGFLRLGGSIVRANPGEVWATLPQASVDTSFPIITGSTFSVASGGNLQTALNNAAAADGNLNHEVVIATDATFSGAYTLPARTGTNANGTGWIVVRSGGTLPEEGTRIQPTDTGQMPTLQVNSTSPVLATDLTARHYRLVGLNITVAAGTTFTYDLMRFGDGSSAQASLANQAHHLILDRCYVHGHASSNLVRGLGLNSAHSAIIDCTMSECHGIGRDAQCIGGWNGAGPYLIRNNYLAASGECIMLGGADGWITDQVASDITIQRNHFTKPSTWKTDGFGWTIKNLMELKLGKRVLFEGNVLEHNWDGGTSQYYGLVIKTVNQDGLMTWAEVGHVTVRNNIFRNMVGAWSLSAHPEASLGKPCVPLHHVNVYDNLVYDIGSENGTTFGTLMQMGGDLDHVRIANNTLDRNFATDTAIGFALEADETTPSRTNLELVNNIIPHGTYGIRAEGGAQNKAALDYIWPSSYTCAGNVVVVTDGDFNIANWPTGNTKAASVAAVGYTNTATKDYSLAVGSLALTAGVGATRVGADVPVVLAATSGVVVP